MISITIAELKAEIIRSGYTIDKIADMLGIGRKTMYNKMYSKGKKGGFTVAEAKKLAEILDIDVSMFFKEENQNEHVTESKEKV